MKRPARVLSGAVLLFSSWVLAFASQPVNPILAQARQAIGGDARLKAVRSLSVKGITQDDREAAAHIFTTLQIDFLLPDRFLVSREWPRVFLRRLGGFNGEKLVERKQVDGTWSEAGVGDGSKQAQGAQMSARRRECALYLIAWLLTVPERYAVEFTGGTATDGADSQTDRIDVAGANGLAAQLFFDRRTHLLVKMTYRETVPGAVFTALAPGAPASAKGEPMFRAIEPPDGGTDQVTVHLDDRHTDDGIVFPHTIRIEAGELHEQWRISKFKVNPPLQPSDFERK